MKKSPASIRPRPLTPPVAPAGVEEAAGAYAPARTKTFRVGGSQAVRLPKAFRIPEGDVLIERQGDAVILRPVPPAAPPSEAALRAWLRDLADGRPAGDDDAWLKTDRPGPETNRPMRDLEW